MSAVLDIGGDDLGRLSDKEAVDVFAALLWADSAARGIPAEIDIPRNTDARDGGIDATVKAPVDIAMEGAIRPGVTGYQVKTEKGLNPAARDARRRLLFRPAGGGLRPRIKNCLDRGETLVVVLFGVDAPDREDGSANLIRDDVARVDPSYGDAKVEVWRQDRLIGYIERYPALKRRLKGLRDVQFHAHRQWESISKDMARHFVPGPSQRRLIDRARSELRNTASHADVRIVGRPGSGRTRIVHEITRPDDLAPFVLYFENPSHVRHGGFLSRLLDDGNIRAILAVDECDAENWHYLRDLTEKTAGRVKLVTMYNKKDSDGCHDLEDLGLEEIKKIIMGYGADVPADAVDRLAHACRPSPRYAHHFAELMESDPDGFPARRLSEDAIHEKYIGAGLGPLDGARAEKRKLVLLQFCLFARVGCKGPESDEFEFLRQKSGREDGILPHEFNTIVDELRKLKILQGYKSLYIAPYMLHLWLWNEWWRLYGDGPEPGALLSPGDGMPDALKRAFREMLAGDSSPKIAAARTLLGEGGPFDDGGGAALDDPDGAKAFNALARADPDSALRLLERTVCRWDDRRLAGFATGRRHVVWAIERMAGKSEDLDAVARVLLCLAANENEQGIANNATGIFARLFVMAPGMLAGTPAGVEDRLAVLAEALGHGDGRRRALALAACDSALESVHASRIDFERIHWNPKKWVPDEAEAGAYRRVISMLCRMLDGADRGEGRAAASIILKRAAELCRFGAVSDAVVDALRAVLESGAADRRSVAQAAGLVLRANEGRMGQEAAAACRRLAAELAGGDYVSRLRRYVGADIPPGAAHLPDRSEVDATEKAVRELAAESLRDRGALLGQADWLFGPGVGYARMFGRELGARDAGYTLLPDLLAAMSRSGADLSGQMIGGYMEEVSLGNRALWEETADAMERSERLAPLVPAVTWSAGVTDRSWDRLVRLYERGAAKKSGLSMFAHGGRACELSDRAFGEALEIMLAGPTADGMGDALAFLSGRCECADPERTIPAEQACRVVLDDAFLAAPQDGNKAGIVDARWAAVVRRLARDDPGLVPRIVGAVFRAMGSDDGIFSGPCDAALGALDAMAEAMPEKVWECAAGHLEAPPDKRTHRILEWAGGRLLGAPRRQGADGAALLDMVAPKSVWAWVGRDSIARASCIAKFAPRRVSGRRCIARELLVLYGGHKQVRDALHRNFMGAGWDGSGVGHYSRAKRECREIAAAESDPNVGRWLAERLAIIDAAMEEEAALEARM